VNVHAQPVAGAVHVERFVLFRLDQFLDIALQHTERRQPLGQRPHAASCGSLKWQPGRTWAMAAFCAASTSS